MIQVHSNFLDELEDYLLERPDDDDDANRMLEQIDVYFNNQARVDDYQAETMEFINKELSTK